MNKKIEELTPEQDAKLETYFKKWTETGLEVKKLDHKKAKTLIKNCYKSVDLEEPKKLEFFKSPYAMLERGAELELGSSATKKELAERVRDLLYSVCYGQHDANWLGFYEFFEKELDLTDEVKELSPMIESAKFLHWWLPFENICLFSEFPISLKIENEVLHCENGPALEYADGFSLHYLYGVEVPEWLACVPAKDLDVDRVMGIENVDQRMAGIRKIGIANVKDKLNVKIIDYDGDYELWTIEVQGRRIGPYLKMVGPTSGEDHVEGVGELGMVDPKITTVRDALVFRGGLDSYEPPMFTA